MTIPPGLRTALLPTENQHNEQIAFRHRFLTPVSDTCVVSGFAMGQVIYLDERRNERSQPASITQPLFFFDVSCPLSYLTAERIERKLGQVEWVSVDGASLGAVAGHETAFAQADDPGLRNRADSCARALRLP